MKLVTIILTSCLWPLASSHPTALPFTNEEMQRFEDIIDEILGKNNGDHIVPSHHSGAPDNSPSEDSGPKPGRIRRITTATVANTNASSPFALAPNANFTSSNQTGSIRCTAGGSSFVDATVSGSPPLSDCAALADSLAQNPANLGYWLYGADDAARRNVTGTKMLASSGACAFGVTIGANMTAGQSVKVGVLDAVEVIKGAVTKFGNATHTLGNGNGTTATTATAMAPMSTGSGAGVPKLGAAGAFQCDVGPAVMVNWALYHTV